MSALIHRTPVGGRVSGIHPFEPIGGVLTRLLAQLDSRRRAYTRTKSGYWLRSHSPRKEPRDPYTLDLFADNSNKKPYPR